MRLLHAPFGTRLVELPVVLCCLVNLRPMSASPVTPQAQMESDRRSSERTREEMNETQRLRLQRKDAHS